MIAISEWLPNPKGADAANEWIEVGNTGESAVTLQGWSLKTSSGKKFTFGETRIEPGAYRVMSRSATKLSLKNTDESLSLFDAAGNLVSQSAFMGTAPEGESVNVWGESYFFGIPTPGKENIVKATAEIARAAYPAGIPLNRPLSFVDLITLCFGVACAAACVTQFVVTRNEHLSNLFFKRD